MIQFAPPSFLDSLAALLPADAILTDPSDCAGYATDWTRTPGKPSLVVLPRTTEEVARVLKLCSEKKMPVVPSAGRTGLAGGATAANGELVLSLERMTRLDTVDTLQRTLRVQAGAVTQTVHEHCAPHGLTWPIELASKGSCRIGGNLSTNAGGLNVVRYGMARKWVTGLQVVLMSGEVIELNPGLEKNNTGYDLMQLVLGSEGTLAVITEATLKLAPVPRAETLATFLFAVPSLAAMAPLYERARAAAFTVRACEFFSAKCLAQVEQRLSRKSRLQTAGAFYLLIEVEGQEGRDEWLSGVLESGLVLDGMLAESAEDRRAVWGLREGITESLSHTPPVRKHDLALPVRRVPAVLEEVEALVKKRGYRLDVYFFGHYGDGSPHINLLHPPNVSADDFVADAKKFDADLFALIKREQGSVSAEHGIGLLKKEWVKYSRTAAELRLFREIKKAFDPDGLLNPGKLID